MASSKPHYLRDWQRRWRREALRVLGGNCVRCGFDDARALQIDHVNGDGYKELRRGNRSDIGSYYRRVVQQAASGRYQLLCANCNWIKRAEQQEHVARVEVVA